MSMDHMSRELNHLKKLTGKNEPELYARLQAAWMSICLLNDARLKSKLETTTHPGSFRQDFTADLLQAVAEMESACRTDPEILGIMRRIRQFVHDHPELCGRPDRK